jgi:hypothetical protein
LRERVLAIQAWRGNRVALGNPPDLAGARQHIGIELFLSGARAPDFRLYAAVKSR